MSKLQSGFLAVLFLTACILLALPPAVFGATLLGDVNVEPMTSTLNAQYVEALTKITVTHATVIFSVSLYLQYNGSDGSQCLKFGIYGDNGGSYGQSSPFGQPLISSTQYGYCFKVWSGGFGPGWETWVLQPSDYLTIPTAGVYWLAVLPKLSYGLIYHYTYTGLNVAPNIGSWSQSMYNYGYFMYGFPVSYVLGFPPVVFANGATGCMGGLIAPCNDVGQTNAGEYNAPYSFYVVGT